MHIGNIDIAAARSLRGLPGNTQSFPARHDSRFTRQRGHCEVAVLGSQVDGVRKIVRTFAEHDGQPKSHLPLQCCLVNGHLNGLQWFSYGPPRIVMTFDGVHVQCIRHGCQLEMVCCDFLSTRLQHSLALNVEAEGIE